MADQTVALVNPSTGELLQTTPEGARVAASEGWVVPSPDQLKSILSKKAMTEEEGGFTGGLKSAAEGAAQTLSFGTSSYAEKALGVDPERIKLREELHPVLHGLGTVAPIFATAGAAAPEELASLTAPRLIERAGQTAGTAVSNALGEGLASKTLSNAARVGLEGALYTAGDNVHESALGQPLFSGESAARIAMGGFLGGGLGVGSGLLGDLVGTAAPRLSSWLRDFQSEQYGEALGVKGGKNADLLKAADNAGYLGAFTTPDRFASKAARGMEKADAQVEQVLKQADLGQLPGRTRIDPVIVSDVEQKFAGLGDVPGPVKDWLDQQGLNEGLGAKSVPLTDLYSLGTQSGDPAIQKTVAKMIDDRLGDSSVWKKAMKARQVAEDSLALAQKAQEAAESARAGRFNPLSAAEILEGIHGGPLKALGVAAARYGLEKYGPGIGASLAGTLANATEKLAPSAAKGVAMRNAAREVLEPAGTFTQAPDAVGLPPSVASTVQPREPVASPQKAAALIAMKKQVNLAQDEVAATAKSLLGEPPAAEAVKESQADIAKQIEQVKALANDPDQLARAIESHVGDLQDHAPQAAQVASNTLARAVAFLAQKAPSVQPSLLDPDATMSPAALSKWQTYLEAIKNPAQALKTSHDLPSTWEAVSAVYPGHAQELGVHIASQLGKAPTYQQAMRLAPILGPLDRTMAPGGSTEFQSLMNVAPPPHAAGKPKRGGGGRFSKSQMSKAKFSQAAQTPFQRSLNEEA